MAPLQIQRGASHTCIGLERWIIAVVLYAMMGSLFLVLSQLVLNRRPAAGRTVGKPTASSRTGYSPPSTLARECTIWPPPRVSHPVPSRPIPPNASSSLTLCASATGTDAALPAASAMPGILGDARLRGALPHRSASYGLAGKGTDSLRTDDGHAGAADVVH